MQKLVSERKTDLLKSSASYKSVQKGLARQNAPVLRAEERLKGLYSLFTSFGTDWDIEKIYDILALRIVVRSVEDCYRALGAIHSIWRPLPGRIKDYIAFPKPNGYRSFHTTVFTGDGGVVEIQIRTEEMHRESEYGAALHVDYKEQERHAKTGWKESLFKALLSWRGKNSQKEAEEKGNGVLNEEKAGNGVPSWVRELDLTWTRAGCKNTCARFLQNRISSLHRKATLLTSHRFFAD